MKGFPGAINCPSTAGKWMHGAAPMPDPAPDERMSEAKQAFDDLVTFAYNNLDFSKARAILAAAHVERLERELDAATSALKYERDVWGVRQDEYDAAISEASALASALKLAEAERDWLAEKCSEGYGTDDLEYSTLGEFPTNVQEWLEAAHAHASDVMGEDT